MKITYVDDYAAMSQVSTQLLMDDLKKKKDLLVCAATGGSPTGLYQNLAKEYNTNSAAFDHLRILKLDEWGGIPMSDEGTCETYLKQHVLAPLHISNDRFIAFNSETKDDHAECVRIQNEIDKVGPIDFCILGIGKNGHLGLNEPAEFLQSECHVAELAQRTLQHSMIQAMPNIPTSGLTVGLRSLFQSKRILLLITGKEKEEAIKRLLTKKITNQLPASLLWLHANTECIIDKTSC